MAIDDAPAFALGTKIRKDFPPHGTFDGEVTQLPDDDYNVYTVVYSDEEVKHYTEDELRPLVERYHPCWVLCTALHYLVFSKQLYSFSLGLVLLLFFRRESAIEAANLWTKGVLFHSFYSCIHSLSSSSFFTFL